MRRLTPRELTAGIKDFDIGDQGTTQLPPDPPEEKLVSWKGALVSPAAVEVEPDEDHWDHLRKDMRRIVNQRRVAELHTHHLTSRDVIFH